MKCPFCGGTVQEYGWQCSGGSVRASLCCDVSMELIENYDVFEALPPPLQQAALEGDKAQQAAVFAKAREHAVAFQASRDRWMRTHAHLFKGEGKLIPYDREEERKQQCLSTE